MRQTIVPIVAVLLAAAAPSWQGAVAAERTVHLVSLGWHAGIAVEIDDAVRRRLPAISAAFPDARLLEFGWGDAAFYQAEDPSIALAFDAALQPGPAVLHVYATRRQPTELFPTAEIVPIELDSAGHDGLLRHIANSLQRNQDDLPRFVGPGLYGEGRSRFYAATGEFHLFRTCNSWAAEALAAGGLDLEPGGIITAAALTSAVRAALAQRRK